MKVNWLKTALDDLQQIAEYIAKDSSEAAHRTITRIREASVHLSTQPEMGRRGRVTGTRELVISGTPYLVIYRITNECVEILRVFHSKQKSREHV